MKKRTLFIVVLLTFIGFRLYASGESGSFLKNGLSARACALGQAFVSISGDATGIYYNPAGLSGIVQKDLQMMYADLYSNSYTNLGIYMANLIYIHPLSKNRGILGVMYAVSGVKDIPITDYNRDSLGYPGSSPSFLQDSNGYPKVLGHFKSLDNALYISFAKKVKIMNLDKLSFAVGLSLKRISQGFSGNSISNSSDVVYNSINKMINSAGAGWGFDFGLLYDKIKNFSAGVNLQNIGGTKLKWNVAQKYGEYGELPMNLKYGVSYKYYIRKLKISFLESLEFNNTFKTKLFNYRDGVEISYQKFLSLRGGINEKNLAVGAGINYDFKHVAASLDYSLQFHTLGYTQKLSIAMKF